MSINDIRRLSVDQRGMTLIEYSLLVSLLCFALIFSVSYVSSATMLTFSNAGLQLQTGSGVDIPPPHPLTPVEAEDPVYETAREVD